MEDLGIASILSGDLDYELITEENPDNLDRAVETYKPDLVVISYDVLKRRDSWNLGVRTAYCASNREDLEAGAEYGLETIGLAKDANELLKKMGEEPYMPKGATKKKAAEKPEAKKQETGRPERKKPETARRKDPEPEADDEDEFSDPLDDLIAGLGGETESARPSAKKAAAKKETPKRQAERPRKRPEPEPEPEEEDFPELDDDYDDDLYGDIEKELAEKSVAEEDKPVSAKGNTAGASKKASSGDAIKDGFDRDVSGQESPTKIIAVYSAKGGVGKTTIASELATYLSLVDLGPRKLRVCIVDYNIDFGDVKSTLGMEKSTKSLTYWADEVREFIEKGADPEEIVYTKQEMEDYMVKSDKSDLWILPAPVSNEDSMGISSEELRVILRNLRDYGEFDFIICDTGNNTRDSTMIALENANTILMIMTQNVNTANCDISFMKTMETIDFDMSNTKLVINNIVPQKLTGISVEEIERYFPFECVGRIHYNPDVMKATNLGEPLALDPSHEFTKQMKDIVAYILNDETLKSDPVPEKKGLFGFLKRKKKKK